MQLPLTLVISSFHWVKRTQATAPGLYRCLSARSPYKKELAKIGTATLALTVTTASLDRNAPQLNTSDPNQAALTIAVKRLTMSIKQLVNEGKDINNMYGDLLGLVSQSPR